MRAVAESYRKLISVLALLGLLALSGPLVTPRLALAATNPITTENAQPGSANWQLTLAADDVSNQIKGYASAPSVLQGGSLALYVTTNPPQSYSIDVYRVGWYQGLGGRLELHAGPLAGTSQTPCLPDTTTGLIVCNWTAGYTMAIPTGWTSGVYLAVLTNAAGYQNYVNFVVRDGRPAPFLVQRSMNTAQAYNNYPNDNRTGKSLYEFNSFGAPTVAGTTRAVKVSFDRPFYDDGSGDFLSWEVQFVRWVEKSGYDATYSTDVDTHANGAELLRHQAFISIGHDEYWSNEMYNAAQAARDRGVNLGFFGANPLYWQVRFEASAAGVANRVVVCYKDARIDPVQGPTTTVNWRDAPLNRPEQALIGVMFTNQTSGNSNVPYVVKNSSNWVYANTGFKDGDSVAGLVGYEADKTFATYPVPAANQVLLSQSPFVAAFGNGPDTSNSSIYQAPSGAWVFATGTMSWSWFLDNYAMTNATDARIQQATTNVLNAFQSKPALTGLKLTAPATASSGTPFTVTVTAVDGQGRAFTSYTGTVHFSSSDTSAGVALPPDYTFTAADAGSHTFSATLIRSGPQTMTVSDAANNLSATSSIAVNPAPATKLVLTSASSTTPAGSPVSFAVAARDNNGNIDTSYAGRIHFTSSDPSGSLPADATLTNGQGSFTATLKTIGSQSITATDTVTTTITGQLVLQVTTASAASLTLVTPGSVKANASFSVTVTLKDGLGNVATTYTGKVHFSSSDPTATLPADYTFTAADAGTHTFSAVLMVPPSQTISVADTVNPTLSASRTINVTLL
jgi:hypothetical protein